MQQLFQVQVCCQDQVRPGHPHQCRTPDTKTSACSATTTATYFMILIENIFETNGDSGILMTVKVKNSNDMSFKAKAFVSGHVQSAKRTCERLQKCKYYPTYDLI